MSLMLTSVIGKSSVHKTAKWGAAFVRNALLGTSTDRENSVQSSRGALRDCEENRGITSALP